MPDFQIKVQASVLAFFKPLTEWIGYDKPEVSSIVITLTTKVTVLWLLASSLLAGVNTFFGDPIDCMVEEVPEGIYEFLRSIKLNTNISIKTFPLYICRSQLNAFIYIINILQLNKRRSTSKIIDL